MIDVHVLIFLPILVPLLTAIVSILAWNRRQLQRVISMIGAAGLLVAGIALLLLVQAQGTQVVQMGGWEAPYGISLVADLFSAIMVVLAGVMGLTVGVYSLADLDPAREAFGYHPLFHILLMGVCGSFLTGDIFNLFVWFEVVLIASFVLLALGGERPQMEGAIKYVTLNLLASAVFLAAVGIVYGVAGTLNMADLAQQLNTVASEGMVTTLAMMFLVAFGIKAAIFPLYFWLPAAYHTPPAAVSAIFAGLLTKVGVYAIVRVFTLLFVQDIAYTHTLILMIIAGFTMVTGVLGAAVQTDFRRILAFHSISQIGYMMMGLALFSPLAIAGAIFFIIHHSVVKSNLFLISGIVYHLRGTFQIQDLGGLYKTHPGLAILFLIPALSLAGLPPFSGFWAKLILIRAGLALDQYVIVATSLAVSLITLFSMTKIWAEVFWKIDPMVEPAPVATIRGSRLQLLVPAATLTLFAILIGLAAEPVFSLYMSAAETLLNPSGYIQTVLGGLP